MIKNELDYDEDPEIFESDHEGDEDAYDGEAVSSIPFDPSEFEEVEDDE